jgi:hypothetical protein
MSYHEINYVTKLGVCRVTMPLYSFRQCGKERKMMSRFGDVRLQTVLCWILEPLGTTSNSSSNADIHNSRQVFSSLQCFQQPFASNAFSQWRFFSFPRSGPIFTASHAELNSQLTTPNWTIAPPLLSLPCRTQLSTNKRQLTNSQAGGHLTLTS